MIRLLIPASALILLAVPASAAPEHPPKAKISMARARAIALKAAPGRITSAEYEREKGKWRYSFDIRQGRRIHEIGVDANTGHIVESVFEDPRKPD